MPAAKFARQKQPLKSKREWIKSFATVSEGRGLKASSNLAFRTKSYSLHPGAVLSQLLSMFRCAQDPSSYPQ
jgi:hypothetical protein